MFFFFINIKILEIYPYKIFSIFFVLIKLKCIIFFCLEQGLKIQTYLNVFFTSVTCINVKNVMFILVIYIINVKVIMIGLDLPKLNSGKKKIHFNLTRTKNVLKILEIQILIICIFIYKDEKSILIIN